MQSHCGTPSGGKVALEKIKVVPSSDPWYVFINHSLYLYTDFAAPIATEYSNWETDKIIAEELIRNLILAMVAVFIMTLVLLASLISSFYVLICVALTLVSNHWLMLIIACW